MTPSPQEVAALVERLKIWSTRDKKVFPEHSTGDFLGRTADALTAQAERIAELERECAELRRLAANALIPASAVFGVEQDKIEPGIYAEFRSSEKAFLDYATMTAKPTEAPRRDHCATAPPKKFDK